MVQQEFDFFHLDPLRLDAEWVNQPKLFFEHAILLASAREAWEKAKLKRDLTAADLATDIRKDPARYGITKQTVDAVKDCVTIQREMITVESEVVVARHKVDELQSVVDALEHRKKALERLVDLRLAHYFSEPRASRDNRDAMDELKVKAAREKARR